MLSPTITIFWPTSRAHDTSTGGGRHGARARQSCVSRLVLLQCPNSACAMLRAYAGVEFDGTQAPCANDDGKQCE